MVLNTMVSRHTNKAFYVDKKNKAFYFVLSTCDVNILIMGPFVPTTISGDEVSKYPTLDANLHYLSCVKVSLIQIDLSFMS